MGKKKKNFCYSLLVTVALVTVESFSSLLNPKPSLLFLHMGTRGRDDSNDSTDCTRYLCALNMLNMHNMHNMRARVLACWRVGQDGSKGFEVKNFLMRQPEVEEFDWDQQVPCCLLRPSIPSYSLPPLLLPPSVLPFFFAALVPAPPSFSSCLPPPAVRRRGGACYMWCMRCVWCTACGRARGASGHACLTANRS